jgi:hypothetical protein
MKVDDQSHRRVLRNSKQLNVGEGLAFKKWRFLFGGDKVGFLR